AGPERARQFHRAAIGGRVRRPEKRRTVLADGIPDAHCRGGLEGEVRFWRLDTGPRAAVPDPDPSGTPGTTIPRLDSGALTLLAPSRPDHPERQRDEQEKGGVDEGECFFTPIVKQNPSEPVLNERPGIARLFAGVNS